MGQTCFDLALVLYDAVAGAKEFWAAVVGAVIGAMVGGAIAYAIQIRALNEGRKQRTDDRRRIDQALGNALIFKMLRIHSNIYTAHSYIEGCFEDASRTGPQSEPWQFLQPVANPPDYVQLSSDEMGMLLGLKDNDVFNAVFQMDVVHNSLIDSIRALGAERIALAERLRVDVVNVGSFTTVMDEPTMRSLRPRMLRINSLAEEVRSNTRKDLTEATEALERLSKLLSVKLGLQYTLESKIKSRLQPTPAQQNPPA